MKNIVIVGVLDVASSTNVSMAKAFMRLGLNVIPVNYRTIIQEYGYPKFEELLIHTVKKYSPVLTIFCKCNGINSDIILECNKYTRTWLWNMDPIQTIKRCPEVIQHAKNANFSSCTGGGTTDYFRRSGVSVCSTIFDGLDFDSYLPRFPVAKYKSDVSFIGGKTRERDELKKVLEDICDVKFYGQGYLPPVYNEEFSDVCSSSKFMLSLNTYNNIPDYFSNRLLRYMGCGSCVLHYDPTKTINKYFEQNVHLLAFSDVQMLAYYVKNIDDETAGKIALNGRDKILNEYTWKHTAVNILKVAGLVK